MLCENFEFLNDVELRFEGKIVSLKGFYEFSSCLSYPLDKKVSLNFEPCYPIDSNKMADYPVTMEFLGVGKLSTSLNFPDMQRETGGLLYTGFKPPEDEDMSHFQDHDMASPDDHFVFFFDPFGYIRIGAQSCRLTRRTPTLHSMS